AVLFQLQQIGEAVLLDLETDADGVHAALEELVELPVALGLRRGIADDERRAIGLAPVAVGRLPVAVAVEQRIGGARIVRNRAAIVGIVPGDTRRYRVMGAHRLA